MIVPFLLAAAQWTPLFDGKTLDGWVPNNGSAKYTVENKEIVGSTVVGSPNSFLCTKKTYSDFELEFEVKVDPSLNSGVQIRSHSTPGYSAGRVHGYQVEIDPSERAFSGGIYDEARRGWLQDLSTNDAGRKAFKNNQWNRFRVIAKGDWIRTWVNGVAAADLHDPVAREGFIALQVHSHDKNGVQVRWRNLRIKETASIPKSAKWLLKTEKDTANFIEEPKYDGPIRWKWLGDCLEVASGSGNILSKDSFGNCHLHVEFAVDDNGLEGQANGNSGVYLMQSYEVQILNSAPRAPANNECGAIYGVKAPDFAMAMPPGVWQTYDIDFTAPTWGGSKKLTNARITAYHNGVRIHDNVEVPGMTGSGTPEAPGKRPFRLQNHGNHIRFRNIWVSE